MNVILSVWWRALVAIRAIERAAGMTLLVLIVLMITVQVITRYAMNRPIVWVEDAATFAFIWLVFLGAAIGLKELRHILIQTFVGALPLKPQMVFNAALYALIAAVCVTVASYAWGVMDTESRSLTISLPVNVPRHWFYSVPLFVCLVSMAFTAAYFVCASLACASTGREIDAEVDARRRAEVEHALDEAEVRIAEKSL